MTHEPRDVFKHTMEGDDDMPAHVKSSLVGASVSVPITNGRFQLGTWQGIYLFEHRNTGKWRRGGVGRLHTNVRIVP